MQVFGVAVREWTRIGEYLCGGAIVDGEEKPARMAEGTYMVARKGQSPSEMKGDIDQGRVGHLRRAGHLYMALPIHSSSGWLSTLHPRDLIPLCRRPAARSCS